jgi:hypothetical protein
MRAEITSLLIGLAAVGFLVFIMLSAFGVIPDDDYDPEEDGPAPQPGGSPAAPTGNDAVTTLARAIAAVEGFGADPSNRPTRNNNPGDLDAIPGGWAGQVGTDGQFAVFASPEAGWAALMKDLSNHAAANPGQPLDSYLTSYGGYSQSQISQVAAALGAGPGSTLGSIFA